MRLLGMTGSTERPPLERWQIAYLPVYPACAAFVVIAFPPLFAYA